MRIRFTEELGFVASRRQATVDLDDLPPGLRPAALGLERLSGIAAVAGDFPGSGSIGIEVESDAGTEAFRLRDDAVPEEFEPLLNHLRSIAKPAGY